MEIREDGGEDIEVNANSESDVWSEPVEHDGFDNNEPDLEVTLSPEYQGDTHFIVDDLYNQL